MAGQPGMHHELVLIDQIQLRQRWRERHTAQKQPTVLPLIYCDEVLLGRQPQSARFPRN